MGSNVLLLVSCVSAKRPTPAPAHDLYVSPLFRKARAYVESQGTPWFTLSAEHGLLHPDTVVVPYERTLNKMRIQDRRDWARRVLAALEVQLCTIHTVVFLAGERYREFLEPALRERFAVEVPLAGLTIGRQLQWFVQRARGQ
jgi:uncharacterized protein DUF6884